MKKTIGLLKKLLAIESVSGHEAKIQQFIFSYLADLGVKPFWVGKNLVVKISGLNHCKALIFDAHVDTVEPGSFHQWRRPPFEGYLDDCKMYGLGASDEKAGVVSLLLLASQLQKQKPACDIWLAFVVKEEVDGSGSREFVDWFTQNQIQLYQSVAAILLEPTGLTVVEIGHRGNVFIKLITKGDGGHASQPHKIKNNAVLMMLEVLKKLEKLKWDNFEDKILGKPSIGLGTSISAGNIDTPNKFADQCVATLDIRTTPKLHHQVLKILQGYLTEGRVICEYLYPPVGFGLTNRNDPIVHSIKLVKPKIKIDYSQSSNDMCFFTQHHIPAIVFGPGESKCMHQPNEYCKIEKVDQAVALFVKLLERWATNESR
jgi:acetylornithine deacetylase/succinyl-diaminopimelate desuccinylase-like protein